MNQVKTLSESCLLSKVRIRTFVREKTDKSVAREIDNTKGNKNGGRYTKTLFKHAQEIKKVYSKVQDIYNFQKEYSLPWLDGGVRMVPSDHYDTYIEGINKRKQELETLFEPVRQNYDALVSKDIDDLGGVAKPHEYPTFDAFKDSFSVDVVLMPVPDSRDFRVTISEDLKDSLDKMLEESKIKGKRELFGRIVGVCERISEQCRKEKGKIYDSMLESALDLSNVIDILNVHKDEELEDLNKDLYALATSTDTFQLRNNMSHRTNLATLAEKLISKLGGKSVSSIPLVDEDEAENMDYGHTSPTTSRPNDSAFDVI